MSFVLSAQQAWHKGEEEMRTLMHSDRHENPNSPFLIPSGAYMLQTAPLLAVGTLDSQGRPWTSLWGGEPGFARPLGQNLVGIRNIVDAKFDPVVEVLYGGQAGMKATSDEGSEKMVSGLTIDMENRKRVKVFGRMVAGALSMYEDDGEEAGLEGSRGEAQLVLKIEQSLANCPKYISSKHITPNLPQPKLLSDSSKLPSEALDLISSADTFFIASANSTYDMDCNIRGGPPGFVRVAPSSSQNTILVWPEYSGNRLYETLGNLTSYPKAGLVIPSFTTGDVLHLTGTTQILHGKDASNLLPHTNLAVCFTVVAARLVSGALSFRGHDTPQGPSPYNPPVRYLVTEKTPPATLATPTTATLVSSRRITPTIAVHRFSLSNPQSWLPGQHVGLSFAEDLDTGYSHMRDDDPRSLNDDFVRTFTISSGAPASGAKKSEFEITTRNVGTVTAYLAKYALPGRQPTLETEVKGFGGDEYGIISGLETPASAPSKVFFVTAGIGITPLLGLLRSPENSIHIPHFTLFWSVAASDLPLVRYVLNTTPAIGPRLRLFVTGAITAEAENEIQKLEIASVERRRICEADLKRENGSASAPTHENYWYLCTGPALRREIQRWLGTSVRVRYEDFGY